MLPKKRMRYRVIETFTGPFAIIQDADGCFTTTWLDLGNDDILPSNAVHDYCIRPELAARLQRYFSGENVNFVDIPTPHGPRFIQRCWEACRKIQRGQTCSYGQLAIMAGGTASAARAAGQAMKRNPLPIIIPCHRVVATNGDLQGFSGSNDADGPEIAVKRGLLQMEGAPGFSDLSDLQLQLH